MTNLSHTKLSEVAALVRQRAEAALAASASGRFMVAVAGPPGAGKSTSAAALAAKVPGARVVPMDGFHYDNAILDARGLRAVKGSPPTFDAAGFRALLHRLRVEGDVAIPTFDRSEDLARAGAEIVSADERILIVEGNYLLLDDPAWADLPFDMTLFLSVPEEELHRRLLARWIDLGLGEEVARQKAEGNDLPNARLVNRASRPADLTLVWPFTLD